MYRLIDFRPVDAHQWCKNGDHPCDYSTLLQSSDGPFLSEGEVVRRFINPNMNGDHYCTKCGNRAKIHGWIDQGDEGLTVCPGDWVVSMGPRYLVLSDHNFQALFYSTVSGRTPPEPMQAVSYSSDKPAEPRVASVRQAWENITTLAGEPQEPEEDKSVDNSAAFQLDKIVAEFDMSYTEIAPNVMACALVHQGANLTVTGLASCLDPDQYDMKRAKEHAYNDAAGKVHQFEQYRKGMNKHLQETPDRNTSVAPMPALDDYFDIGEARRHLMDGRKVSHRNWGSGGVFVFYVPPGKYPASRNGKGTLLGLYPDDMVPYNGYLAMRTADGSVVPWQPTSAEVTNAWWYLVE